MTFWMFLCGYSLNDNSVDGSDEPANFVEVIYDICHSGVDGSWGEFFDEVSELSDLFIFGSGNFPTPFISFVVDFFRKCNGDESRCAHLIGSETIFHNNHKENSFCFNCYFFMKIEKIQIVDPAAKFDFFQNRRQE